MQNSHLKIETKIKNKTKKEEINNKNIICKYEIKANMYSHILDEQKGVENRKQIIVIIYLSQK